MPLEEISISKLSDEIIDEVLNAGMESDDLDFKLEFSLSNKQSHLEVAKDIFAMANTNGGYIVFGVDNNFQKKGLPIDYHYDQMDILNAIRNYCYPHPEFDYKEFKRVVDGVEKKFSVIYVRPTKEIIITTKDGCFQLGKQTGKAFRARAIYVRKTSSSEEADYSDIRKLLNKIITSGFTSDEKKHKIKSFLELLGERVRPQANKEKLFSNLIGISGMPSDLWVAKTDFRTRGAIYYELYNKHGINGSDVPAFITKEGSIISFSDLKNEENPLNLVIYKDDVETNKTEELVNNLEHTTYVIELLNAVVRTHLQKKGLFFDNDYQRYYYRTNGDEKAFRWKAYNRISPLKVVSIYKNKKDNTVINYQHKAIRVGTIKIDTNFFFFLDPSWTFTSDGKNLISPKRRGSLSNRLNRGLQNKRYLYILKFWISNLFSSGRIYVTKDTFISIDTQPVSTEISFGLKNDYLDIETFFEIVPVKEIEEEHLEKKKLTEEADLELEDIELEESD